MEPTVQLDGAGKAQPWSMKHIHRLIVHSATYRQSSKVRPDLKEVDANNKLLARQNRLRLDAEVVRDVGLASSGLYNPMIGGPSVFPPQPDGVMNLGQSRRPWKASEGKDRYRRGLYTFFWRATPHPALAVFDAPDSFSVCTRRVKSNTPLQALTLLNDQAFLEFAQGLAQRTMKEGGRGDSEKINYAFRLCLSRSPDEIEKKRLLQLLKEERTALKTEGPQHGLTTLEEIELAAWTSVARALLNLDETITRE
jgi:hypothetical protein